MSAVSNVCGKERAEVSSVSGEVVGGCCEVAVALIGAKKIAQQEWILEQTAKKFAPQAKKGRFWGVLRALGELFRAGTLMEARRANFFALVWPSRG